METWPGVGTLGLDEDTYVKMIEDRIKRQIHLDVCGGDAVGRGQKGDAENGELRESSFNWMTATVFPWETREAD